MNCIKCGRPLKDPESVRRQMGPVCAMKKTIEQLGSDPDQTILPFGKNDDIILKREGSRKVMNVVHQVVKHSPTGMEWGYGGSGPSDLALNICLMFVHREAAFRIYQDFKWKFIATLPAEGGVIKRKEIIKFIENHSLRFHKTAQKELYDIT